MSDYLGTKLDFEQVIRRVYDEDENRLRVDAEVTATIGTVEVAIDAASGDNIAIASPDGANTLLINPDGSINTNTTITDITLNQATDSIAIGDGTNLAHFNADGSLNVVIQDSALTTKNLFNEIDNVVSGVTSQIISYTAVANTKLLSCDFGGTNVAAYSLYIGATLSAKKYTFFQNLNERFEFADGLPIMLGDVITVEVIHNRPDPGAFNVNMLIKN